MIVALVALALQPLAAPATSAAGPAAITLPAFTSVRFVTESTIDSRTVQQGQRFAIIVAEDVMVGDIAVLPQGTRAVGEVDAVTGTGMFGKAGSLVLRPLFVEIGGQRINLEGVMEQRGKQQVGSAAVTTFLTGGLGLIITGKSAKLPAGTPLEGRIRSDATLVRPIR
jgi:hypothetical protein